MSTPPLRLLCVDDETRILRALKALFRDYEVYTTSNPREAVDIAKQYDIDVIICDQRMPEMQGLEVLRDVKTAMPRAMRILLTGYSDLKSILGSVNEGEVFRFVNKPWNNTELRDVVMQAGQIAREAPVITSDQLDPQEYESARTQVGVLVLEDDPTVQQRLREILQPYYQVRFATSVDRALQILEKHETGVLISETESRQDDFPSLLKALKQYHPHIATVVITQRANAQMAIDLINEGQVYRMLLKPVRMGSCRLSIDSAIGRYWQLKKNPQAAKRYAVATAPSVTHDNPTPISLSATLLNRIRALPRLLGVARG